MKEEYDLSGLLSACLNRVQWRYIVYSTDQESRCEFGSASSLALFIMTAAGNNLGIAAGT